MNQFEKRGNDLRVAAKSMVLEFMNSKPKCNRLGEGIKQAHVFRECGLDWGDYKNAESSKQQYWIVALMRELESEGKVERVTESGPWRLK